MNDLRGRIEELEVKAAESALIADLTTNWEIRTYNSRLAKDLREAADLLRRRAKMAALLARFLALLKATSSGSCAGLPCQPP